jgi:hypothetical protein
LRTGLAIEPAFALRTGRTNFSARTNLSLQSVLAISPVATGRSLRPDRSVLTVTAIACDRPSLEREHATHQRFDMPGEQHQW